MRKKEIRLFSGIQLQNSCYQENEIPWTDYYPEHLNINYTNQDGLPGQIVMSNSGKKVWQFHWKEEDWLIISQDIYEKYFADIFETGKPIKFLEKINIDEYHKLNLWINQLAQKYKNTKSDNVATKEIIKEKIKFLKDFKKEFEKWFFDWELEIPDIEVENINSSLSVNSKTKKTGGRPPDPIIAELRKTLNKDYYRLTAKKGYNKKKAIKILVEKYPWKKTTIEKYIKT